MACTVETQNSDQWSPWLGTLLGYGSEKQVHSFRQYGPYHQILGFGQRRMYGNLHRPYQYSAGISYLGQTSIFVFSWRR